MRHEQQRLRSSTADAPVEGSIGIVQRYGHAASSDVFLRHVHGLREKVENAGERAEAQINGVPARRGHGTMYANQIFQGVDSCLRRLDRVNRDV